ncbi:MAG: hypothetical protein JW925_07370, partial [Syntrophaceae bacterium]|nr:hypothetical protein [Syntrophaceae bacterium]
GRRKREVMLEKSKIKILVFIVIIGFIFGCVHKKSYFNDKKLHVILYTDPDKDCFSCVLSAIKMIQNTLIGSDEVIHIFIKNKTEKFEQFIREEFPNQSFEFHEGRFSIPHPSIAQIYQNSIIMNFFVMNDPVLLKESLITLGKMSNFPNKP